MSRLLFLPPALKLPKVYVLNEAFRKSVREVRKYYLLGESNGGKPFEASMYFLAALVQRDGVYKSPFDLLELSEIDSIIITHVVYPADRFKDNKVGYAGFKAPEGYSIKAMNDLFRRKLSEYTDKYPLLDVLGNIHSHTCQKSNLLSGGDNNDSKKKMPRFLKNGLGTCFKILMSPNDESGDNWSMYGFGYYRNSMVALPDMFQISRSHGLFKKATQPPCYHNDFFGKWAQQQCQAIEISLGFKLKWEPIVRGWSTLDIEINEKKVCICFSPFFPNEPIKVYCFDGKKYLSVDYMLADYLSFKKTLDDVDLLPLTKRLKEII